MSITDIGRQSAEETTDGSQSVDPDDYERFDVAGMEYVKNHPTTAPSGTARVLRYFPGDPDQEGLDRGFAGLVLDDPFLVDSDELELTFVLENGDDKGDDYKVVDLSDKATDVMTTSGKEDFTDEDADVSLDEIIGVDFDSNSMYGTLLKGISASDAEAIVEAIEGANFTMDELPVDDDQIEALADEWISTPTDVVEADESDLTDADGIGDATADDITEFVESTSVESVSDLPVSTPQVEALERAGFDSIEAIEAADEAELASVTAFPTDTIILKLSGNAGRSATQCLDVSSDSNADVVRNDEGEPVIDEGSGYPTYNDGLIEYVDDDDSDEYTPPRFARDTQLRPDVEGKQVSFLLQRMSEVVDDYDGSSYWSTVLVREDESDDWGEIEPTDEFEPDADLLAATKWLDDSYPSQEEILELREEQDVEVDDDLRERVEEDQEAEAEAE